MLLVLWQAIPNQSPFLGKSFALLPLCLSSCWTFFPGISSLAYPWLQLIVTSSKLISDSRCLVATSAFSPTQAAAPLHRIPHSSIHALSLQYSFFYLIKKVVIIWIKLFSSQDCQLCAEIHLSGTRTQRLLEFRILLTYLSKICSINNARHFICSISKCALTDPVFRNSGRWRGKDRKLTLIKYVIAY